MTEGKWTCPKCHSIIDRDSAFCEKCGADLRGLDLTAEQEAKEKRYCTQCGALLGKGMQFCGNCGAPVIEQAPSAVGPEPGAMSYGQLQPRGFVGNKYFPRSPVFQWSTPNDASFKTAFKDNYFNFTGRLNRWPYIARNILLSSIVSFIFGILFIPAQILFWPILFGLGYHDVGAGLIFVGLCGLALLVIGIFFMLCYISLYVKRCHDLGHSGWMVLLMLIPLINFCLILYLFFAKGTRGPNEYGEDPIPANL